MTQTRFETTQWICTFLQVDGQLAEAQTHAVELLKPCRRLSGDDHPETAQAALLVGTIHGAEAEPRMRESREVTLRTQGPR